MKTFEVVLDKPSKKQDWCLWDNKTIYVDVPTTTALITAFNEERLYSKLRKLYPDVKVISVLECK